MVKCQMCGIDQRHDLILYRLRISSCSSTYLSSFFGNYYEKIICLSCYNQIKEFIANKGWYYGRAGKS